MGGKGKDSSACGIVEKWIRNKTSRNISVEKYDDDLMDKLLDRVDMADYDIHISQARHNEEVAKKHISVETLNLSWVSEYNIFLRDKMKIV